MNIKELLNWSRQGIFPGVEESGEQFLARVERLKGLCEKTIPAAHWEWVRLHLQELFDFEPAFVPVFYSNRSLAPWQGAASWFEEGRLVAVQLREGLKKGSFLGLYRREEILAHEAVHAARAALRSVRWEEYFAYMTSEKRWRRVLGPIVRRPWEVWPFAGLAGIGMFWEIGYVLALVWVVLGLGRLMWGHRTLCKASERLLKMTGDRKRARAVLVRLTDAEIEKLARGEPVADDSLRWQSIRLAYFHI